MSEENKPENSDTDESSAVESAPPATTGHPNILPSSAKIVEEGEILEETRRNKKVDSEDEFEPVGCTELETEKSAHRQTIADKEKLEKELSAVEAKLKKLKTEATQAAKSINPRPLGVRVD